MKCLFEVDTICRLCLRTDEKVYRLKNTDQKVFIESIIKLKQDNYVPTDGLYICYICGALLTKTFNFMQTIWSAQKIIFTILKNTNIITKQHLNCIDRHNTGLNPITLSSVVTYCDNVKSDSSNNTSSGSDTSTDIEELDLDHLIKKIKKEEPRKHKNLNMNKINYHSTKVNNKISISDEDEESDKCNLDEMEVEICNNFEIGGIKAESSDPLEKELNTDEPIPKTKKSVLKKNAGVKKNPHFDLVKSKDSTSKRKYVKKNNDDDDDYQPDSTSHSEDSDYDSYDDEGKPIKRPKDDRVYPMQCDHCHFEVLEKCFHYRHYLFMHPNIEYPYKTQKDYACSICGKLYTKQRIASHEASHTKQEIKCNFCPKVCSNKEILYRHVTNVHPKKTFTCDYCSKIFKTKTDILRHIRTHTGSKPFKCHICGDEFAHSGNRSIHIRAKHQNYKYVAKKQKRAQEVRSNKKHCSTDTEISTNSEKSLRKTKTKRKSNNQSENTETTLKKKRKSTKQGSKNKEVGAEVGKQNPKTKKKTKK